MSSLHFDELQTNVIALNFNAVENSVKIWLLL
jgi:hypothetical protein